MNFLIIILLVCAALIMLLVYYFNSLVSLRNQVKNAWAQIDVQLNRRHDLIPNLVETVKGYMQHERATLENVTAARAQAVSANTIGDKARAEDTLVGAIGRLFAVVENYPDLKANQNFLALQEELTSTENKIAFARQNYNDQSLFYNNRIGQFPSNLVANFCGFKPQDYFQIDSAEKKEAPKTKFS
jgi:LemA protein